MRKNVAISLAILFLHSLSLTATAADISEGAVSGVPAERVKQKSSAEIMTQLQAMNWKPFPVYADVAGKIPAPLKNGVTGSSTCDKSTLKFASDRDMQAWTPRMSGEFQMWVFVWGTGYFGERARCGSGVYDGDFIARQFQAALGTPVTGMLTEGELRQVIAKIDDPVERQKYFDRIATGTETTRRLDAIQAKRDELKKSWVQKNAVAATPAVFGIAFDSSLNLPECRSATPQASCYYMNAGNSTQDAQIADVFFTADDRPGWLEPRKDHAQAVADGERECKSVEPKPKETFYCVKEGNGFWFFRNRLDHPVVAPDLQLLLDSEGHVLQMTFTDSLVNRAAKFPALTERFGPGTPITETRRQPAIISRSPPINGVITETEVAPRMIEVEVGMEWNTDDFHVRELHGPPGTIRIVSRKRLDDVNRIYQQQSVPAEIRKALERGRSL